MKKFFLIAIISLLGVACTDPKPIADNFPAYCNYQKEELERRLENYQSLYDSVDTATEAQAVIEAGDLIISAKFALEEWCGIDVDVTDVENKTELLREFDI